MELIFNISTNNDLKTLFDNLSVEIKHRREGRQQFSLELWVLKHYLPKIVDELDFPMKVYKNESPDFIIETRDSKLGIEITEATSEYYQKLLYQLSYKPNYFLKLNNIQYGKEYTNEELYSFLKPKGTPIYGYGWNGYQCEDFASSWVRDAAQKKVCKIKRWEKDYPVRIVIYDNTPTNDLRMDVLSDYLNKKILMNQELNSHRIDFLSSDGSIILKSIKNFIKDTKI